MMDEKVLQQPLTIGASRSVPASGNEEQVELFVGFDQRVDHLPGRRRVYVRVHLRDDEQQLSLQTVRVIHIGRGCVMSAYRPSHPLFVPPHLIHTVVVAAAVGDCSLVKLRMEQQASGRVLTAGGATIYAYAA